MNKSLKYKDVLKNREYRKLLLSSIINRFGDSIDAIAFTWLVYQITKSASWAAFIYTVEKGYIRLYDDTTAPRYYKYVPYWA